MIDQIVAGIVLLGCAGALLRMAIGPARRQRLDAAWHRAVDALRRKSGASRRRTPPEKTIDPAAARREAQQAIDRARRARPEAERDGNVIRPRAFDGSKKKPPLQ